jgi:hypothetical protein
LSDELKQIVPLLKLILAPVLYPFGHVIVIGLGVALFAEQKLRHMLRAILVMTIEFNIVVGALATRKGRLHYLIL